ncbi:TPA: hypothetical protein DIC40_04475 [Patescibacteria group bacterium]|nr:hypothetical protein [Candidatus Gracilibacteria bacterium]
MLLIHNQIASSIIFSVIIGGTTKITTSMENGISDNEGYEVLHKIFCSLGLIGTTLYHQDNKS